MYFLMLKNVYYLKMNSDRPSYVHLICDTCCSVRQKPSITAIHMSDFWVPLSPMILTSFVYLMCRNVACSVGSGGSKHAFSYSFTRKESDDGKCTYKKPNQPWFSLIRSLFMEIAKWQHLTCYYVNTAIRILSHRQTWWCRHHRV